MGTSRELRTRSQQHVTYLQLPKGWCLLDIQLLAAKSWDQLGVLDLRLGHLSIEAAAELSKVHCPTLTQLLISESLDAAPSMRPNIFRLWSQNWPLLHTFECDFRNMRRDEILAVAQISWPNLQSLHLRPLEGATEDLMRGDWPLLRQLSLQGLGYEGTHHLPKFGWHMVESLRLEQCSFQGARVLTQVLFPCLKKLALIDVDFGWSQNWLEQVIKKWPGLTELHLMSKSFHMFRQHLPEDCSLVKLQRLTIHGEYICKRGVGWVFDLQLPALWHVTFCGCSPISAFGLIHKCMKTWPNLRLIQVEKDLHAYGCFELFGEALNLLKSRWPHMDMQYHTGKYDVVKLLLAVGQGD